MGNLFLHSSSSITGYRTQKMASDDQRGATASSNGERGQGDIAPLCAFPAGDVIKLKGYTKGPRLGAEGPRLGAEAPKTLKRARRGLVALGVDQSLGEQGSPDHGNRHGIRHGTITFLTYISYGYASPQNALFKCWRGGGGL